MCLISVTICYLSSRFVINSMGRSVDQHHHSGVRIVAKRVLQPLYHIDFIWNRTEYAARLRKYNKYGRELFSKVSQLTFN